MLWSSKLGTAFPSAQTELSLDELRGEPDQKAEERQHPGEVGKSVSEIDKQCVCWFCNFSPCNGVGQAAAKAFRK